MRLWLLLFSCVLGLRAAAECYYSNYALSLKVITTANEELRCYRTVGGCDLRPDSIGSQAYLLDMLFSPILTMEVGWYARRVAYRYCDGGDPACAEDEKKTLYAYFEAIPLERSRVARIEVVEVERITALDHIATALTIQDTTMLHRSPLEVVHAGGYLCYHWIAVHRRSPEISKVLARIKALNLEIESLGDGLDGDVGDVYDERMQTLVAPLIRMSGLVVVSGCTD